MIHAKRMFLLEPEEYRKMKDSQISSKEPADITVSKLNESLVKDKIMQKNKVDNSWSAFGEKLKPILTDSITQASASVPLASDTSPPPPPPSTSSSGQMIELIRDNVTANFVKN